MAEEWKTWRSSFELYMTASGGEAKEDKVKIAVLLHVAGEETQKNFKQLSLTAAEAGVYESVIGAIEAYFAPETSNLKSVESFKFHRRMQEPGETFDAYVAALKRVAANCKFGDAEERMLVDQIIQGVEDIDLKKRLLATPSLTLAKAIDQGRAMEQVQEQLKIINREREVDAIQKQQSAEAITPRQQPRQEREHGGQQGQRAARGGRRGRQGQQGRQQGGRQGRQQCSKCGLRHEVFHCPAFGVRCYKCGKSNHYARMCRGGKISEIEQSENSSSESVCVIGMSEVNRETCKSKGNGMKRTYTHAHQTCRRTARSRYVRKISDVQDYKGNARLFCNSCFERVRLAGIKRKVEFK